MKTCGAHSVYHAGCIEGSLVTLRRGVWHRHTAGLWRGRCLPFRFHTCLLPLCRPLRWCLRALSSVDVRRDAATMVSWAGAGLHAIENGVGLSAQHAVCEPCTQHSVHCTPMPGDRSVLKLSAAACGLAEEAETPSVDSTELQAQQLVSGSIPRLTDVGAWVAPGP